MRGIHDSPSRDWKLRGWSLSGAKFPPQLRQFAIFRGGDRLSTRVDQGFLPEYFWNITANVELHFLYRNFGIDGFERDKWGSLEAEGFKIIYATFSQSPAFDLFSPASAEGAYHRRSQEVGYAGYGLAGRLIIFSTPLPMFRRNGFSASSSSVAYQVAGMSREVLAIEHNMP